MKAWLTSMLLKLGASAIALYLAKTAGRLEVLKEQAEADADKQKEYAKIAAEHRTVEQLLARLRDGTF